MTTEVEVLEHSATVRWFSEMPPVGKEKFFSRLDDAIRFVVKESILATAMIDLENGTTMKGDAIKKAFATLH